VVPGIGILKQVLEHGADNASPAVIVLGNNIIDPNGLGDKKQRPDGNDFAMKRSNIVTHGRKPVEQVCAKLLKVRKYYPACYFYKPKEELPRANSSTIVLRLAEKRSKVH
jgi:hypothetical protein